MQWLQPAFPHGGASSCGEKSVCLRGLFGGFPPLFPHRSGINFSELCKDVHKALWLGRGPNSPGHVRGLRWRRKSFFLKGLVADFGVDCVFFSPACDLCFVRLGTSHGVW